MSDAPSPIRRLGHIPRPDEFQCEKCKGFFLRTRTDEDLDFEANLSGLTDKSDRAMVCDPCFKELTKDYGDMN